MVLRNLVFVFITLVVLGSHQSFSQQIQLIHDEQSPYYGSVSVEYGQIMDSLEVDGNVAASLQVFVQPQTGPLNETPMLGSIYRLPQRWLFVPRFPFELDQQYRVEFTAGTTELRTHFVPKSPLTEATSPEVLHVLPGDSLLPVNLLRLYVKFSQPMTKHDAYQYVHLLNGQGDTLNNVFYPAEPPLWDKTGQQLTLLFDPGRIKSGLQPNTQWGLGLKANEDYRVLVNGIKDYRGTALRKAFEFNFHTTGPDHSSPQIQNWKVKAPKAYTTEPLVLTLDEPLNPAQAETAFQVMLEQQTVPSAVTVHAKQIEFMASSPWVPGQYNLKVFNTLEDRAGNSLRKLFEVAETADGHKPPEWIEIPFRIINEKP